MQQEVISNFRILENTEKTISYLKKTRQEIFSIDNKHFDWKQYNSIKEIREFPELQKQINLDETDLKIIVENFKKWVKIPTYLMFLDKDNGNLDLALASKRGNKIYEYYLDEKLKKDLKFMKNPNFHKLIFRNKKGFRNKKVSNVSFITLTCDPKKYNNSIIIAWLNFEHDFNIFITRYRKKYGKCWIMKSVESIKKGFPHIHLIIITEKEFEVFKPTRRKCSNKKCKKYFNNFSNNYSILCPYCNSSLDHPYRMLHKRAIEGYWPSLFDILIPDPTQMKNQKEGCMDFMKDYIFKDMLKSYVYKEERNYRNNLSLALNWIFGKRCYSISKMDLSLDLITDASVTQTQIKDFIKKNSERNFIFMGLIDFKFVSNKPPPISFEIPKSDPNYESYLNGIYGLRNKLTFQIIKTPEKKTLTLSRFEPENIVKEKENIQTKRIYLAEDSEEPLIISYHHPATAERFSGSMQKIRRELFIKYLEKQRAIITKEFGRRFIWDPIPKLGSLPELENFKINKTKFQRRLEIAIAKQKDKDNEKLDFNEMIDLIYY